MNISYVCAVLNSSNSEAPPLFPKFYSTGFTLILVTFFGLAGSGFCAYKLRRNANPSLSISIDVLFYGMSILSFLLSLLVLPFHIYTTLTGPVNFLATVPYRPLCSLIGFLLMLTTQAAVSYHAVIALHRYFIVVLSEKRPRLRSKGVLIVLAAVPWVEAILFNIWPFFHVGAEFGYNCMTDRCMLATTYSPKYHVFVRTATPAIALPVMIACYAAICWKVFRLRSRFVRPKHATPTAPGKPVRRLQHKWMEMKVTKVAFVACLTFSACYLPVTIRTLFVRRYEDMYSQLGNAMGILNWLGVLIVLAAVPWVEAVLCNIWPFFHVGAEFGYNCMTDRCMLATTYSPKYHVFVRTATPAIAFPVMIACYAAICWKVFRLRSRFVRPKQATPAAPGKPVRRLQHAWLEMKVTKVAFVACLTFSACYLPVTIRTLFVKRYEDMYSQLGNAMGILNWLGCTLGRWITVYLNGITHAKAAPSASNSANLPPATAELIPSRKTMTAGIPGKELVEERQKTRFTTF